MLSLEERWKEQERLEIFLAILSVQKGNEINKDRAVQDCQKAGKRIWKGNENTIVVEIATINVLENAVKIGKIW